VLNPPPPAGYFIEVQMYFHEQLYNPNIIHLPRYIWIAKSKNTDYTPEEVRQNDHWIGMDLSSDRHLLVRLR